MATSREDATDCAVVTAPDRGRAEVKRLWVDPVMRGRGVGAAPVRACLDRAAASGELVCMEHAA